MKQKRSTKEQIAFISRQHESGTSVERIVRKLGVTVLTFYRWKMKCAGLGVADLRRLKQVEEENGELKPLVEDLSRDSVLGVLKVEYSHSHWT